MLLRDVMTTRIEDISADATLMQVAEKMKQLDVGAVPVSEDNYVVGIITDRDIAVRVVADGRDPRNVSVREAMSGNLYYCYEDESVETAAKLMKEKQIRRLPILDRNDRAVGIVSLGDLAIRNHDDRLSGEVLGQVSQPSHLHA